MNSPAPWGANGWCLLSHSEDSLCTLVTLGVEGLKYAQCRWHLQRLLAAKFLRIAAAWTLFFKDFSSRENLAITKACPMHSHMTTASPYKNNHSLPPVNNFLAWSNFANYVLAHMLRINFLQVKSRSLLLKELLHPLLGLDNTHCKEIVCFSS